MEAIGTAASSLQIAYMATKTSLEVYQFISTIRNAPKEIRNLGRDIMDFHNLVDHLRNALDSEDIQDMVDRDKQINQLMKDLLVPMAKCQITCDQMRSKLIMHLQLEKVGGSSGNENDAFGNRRKEKVRIWVRDWMWPFRRKGVFALMSELDRTRSTYPPPDKKLSPHYT